MHDHFSDAIMVHDNHMCHPVDTANSDDDVNVTDATTAVADHDDDIDIVCCCQQEKACNNQFGGKTLSPCHWCDFHGGGRIQFGKMPLYIAVCLKTVSVRYLCRKRFQVRGFVTSEEVVAKLTGRKERAFDFGSLVIDD